MVQLLHHPEELEGEISSSPLPLFRGEVLRTFFYRIKEGAEGWGVSSSSSFRKGGGRRPEDFSLFLVNCQLFMLVEDSLFVAFVPIH
ncbi:MAG: hypothetical protein A3G52_02755 [Candidatus Taylorbacteria bacterium RIFCSPLOWO2_12_FULL_43_20]|uniref:Uncharacterized protein n=1 Tax=Candidatus Taylorbacteria bacterium RIFCSPLOWO2_12_FULL_43_20 TaxID=1802332 RepID=A0A1G2NZR0_9BACT|nr:MAG: hypothetical protein A2825_02935 [Candidatus Taylorbacteria bacterium RIFCSPHIGHO2_01_FULL_43_120]OHA23644.1 MAG: hypothetical protein A3B98_03250 [Candidatus Taylorbacteria bacterium RIFCSPHIGHO2_02_FULL_43_55]OHA28119.1 MAG: hypothetical protein A3E92_00240 [Candidatus Taylorbacteria bacterium RIFCSPHIGHO2_12_FULL_42_34]OHA32332.1 MAG: hypothetical protein A3B09_03160 [Candidatus Taylorbacteria bacterium RIFCSPLOWO2_01_FULL_43_83]OHA37669.1 MAG: hypothetical protein A3H58_03280 [Candi